MAETIKELCARLRERCEKRLLGAASAVFNVAEIGRLLDALDLELTAAGIAYKEALRELEVERSARAMAESYAASVERRREEWREKYDGICLRRAAAERECDEAQGALASAGDIANTWAREVGVKEAADISGLQLRNVIDRLWSKISTEICSTREERDGAVAACAHYAELLLQWAKFSESPKWNSEVDRQRFYADCKAFLFNRKFDHLQWLKEQRDEARRKALDICRSAVLKCLHDELKNLPNLQTKIHQTVEQVFEGVGRTGDLLK